MGTRSRLGCMAEDPRGSVPPGCGPKSWACAQNDIELAWARDRGSGVWRRIRADDTDPTAAGGGRQRRPTADRGRAGRPAGHAPAWSTDPMTPTPPQRVVVANADQLLIVVALADPPATHRPGLLVNGRVYSPTHPEADRDGGARRCRRLVGQRRVAVDQSWSTAGCTAPPTPKPTAMAVRGDVVAWLGSDESASIQWPTSAPWPSAAASAVSRRPVRSGAGPR